MKKALTILYGVIAYVIFLFTFLYAIGFVGDMIVPKTINSGEESSVLNSILINLGLLSIFAIQHSVMARPEFKKWWTKIIGTTVERSTYVLLSSLALLLIYWQWRPIPLTIWQVDNEMLSVLISSVFFIGWLIVLLSTFMISHFELFGLRQVWTDYKNSKSHSPNFQVNYFYKLVRHPIMLGFIVAFWATPVMTVGHLLFSVVTTAYMILAVKFLEEKDLKRTFGKKYEEYQERVPMLFPKIGFGRRPDVNWEDEKA